MQRTADFHDPIADPDLPQATGVVDYATALDAAVDMLDVYGATRDALIRGLLCAPEGLASRFHRRHDDPHLV